MGSRRLKLRWIAQHAGDVVRADFSGVPLSVWPPGIIRDGRYVAMCGLQVLGEFGTEEEGKRACQEAADAWLAERALRQS